MTGKIIYIFLDMKSNIVYNLENKLQVEGILNMKVVGVITEYNPFHNGHKHHIEEAKKITGADYVIAVMSGDFVQRGGPAVISKHDRCMMALNNGVDLVFELPTCYATGSAQYFALGAISLLSQLNIVDYLCFGSEYGSIAHLEDLANLFNNPTEDFQSLLYSYIKNGITYPAARAMATKHILNESNNIKNSDMLSIISQPNNILGIEYIRALLQEKSSIKPYAIKRQNANYHDKELNTSNNLNNAISSATAIRSILENAKGLFDLSIIQDSVPKNVYDYFTDNHNMTYPVTIENFSSIIKYKLMSESRDELAEYVDLSSDLADRIKNISIENYSIGQLSQMIKTKNITLTRVNRALIHVLLNIKKDDFNKYLDDKIIYYARLLGMNKNASHLIRRIKDQDGLPVITKLSRAKDQLDGLGMQMLNQDIFASHIYNQTIYELYRTKLANEYKRGVCIL